MRSFISIFVFTLVSTGCGAPSAYPIPEESVGEWATNVAVFDSRHTDGDPLGTYPATVSVSATGMVTSICPDGSGKAQASGRGTDELSSGRGFYCDSSDGRFGKLYVTGFLMTWNSDDTVSGQAIATSGSGSSEITYVLKWRATRSSAPHAQ